MKKILSAVIAASVVFCAAGAFAAPQYNDRGNLIVESDINMDEKAKKTTVRGSARLDVTSLYIWKSVGTRAVEKKLFITSEAGRIEEGTVHPFIPVDISLRILNNSAKTKKKYIVGETNADSSDDGKVSVFEYYTLTVSDDDGVVFEADGIPSDTTEIEIPLGTFNYDGENTTASKNYSDERSYTISLKEDKDLNKSDVTEYALPSTWRWYVDAKQQAYLVNGEATPTPKATAAPVHTAEVTASPAAEPKTSAAPTVEPENTPSVRATATPRVRATATPRATVSPFASPKAASSAKASATAAPKTNPKTGDSAPITGLSMLGIMALAAIAVIQVKKKSN